MSYGLHDKQFHITPSSSTLSPTSFFSHSGLSSSHIYTHQSLPLGNHHDYDDVAPDLFQLSEEDVHAFGTNDKLREVLVPFENLQITGELGEGTYVLLSAKRTAYYDNVT